jgi:hypothetical protein
MYVSTIVFKGYFWRLKEISRVEEGLWNECFNILRDFQGGEGKWWTKNLNWESFLTTAWSESQYSRNSHTNNLQAERQPIQTHFQKPRIKKCKNSHYIQTIFVYWRMDVYHHSCHGRAIILLKLASNTNQLINWLVFDTNISYFTTLSWWVVINIDWLIDWCLMPTLAV